MAKIPANIIERVNTLLPDASLASETLSKVKVDNPARRIEFEIGDALQADFLPQFKTKHWDNECNFSARLVAGTGVVTEHDSKLAYDDGEKVARFYEKDTGDEDGGFEFDVVLPKKPKSNVLTWTLQHKELDFFYQPELTQEEIDQGAERPENVVGSYAVYHKTGRNNKVGGKEYRTGKAFHIYRPYAEDAKGDRVWCDLHIDTETNELTVTVPQDYLDKASYPVVVDPTFGYTTQGASTQEAYGNQSFGDLSKIVGDDKNITETGDVSKLTVYVSTKPTATSVTAYGGIFESGSTRPVERVGESVSASVSATGWIDLTYATQPTLTSGDHKLVSYLAAEGAGNYQTGSIAYDSGGSNSALSSVGAANVSQMADTITGDGTGDGPVYHYGTVSGTNRVSIYATYTAAASGYTLTAEVGSFTLTGNTTSLTVARKLTAGAGSFTLTGQATALTVARKLTVEAGTYTLTGNATSLVVSRKLTATTGSLTLTGNDAGLTAARKLTAGVGTFNLTGNDVTFTYSGAGTNCYLLQENGDFLLQETSDKILLESCPKVLVAGSGTFTLTGNDALLKVGRTLTAGTGSYTVTGNDTALTVSRRIVAEAGSYTVTGNNTGLVVGRKLTAETGSFTLTGHDVTFTYEESLRLIAEAGSFTLTGYDVTLTYSGFVPTGNIKYWDGTTWQTKQLTRWNGSTWENATLKRWNGSTWETISY